jgi:hypothetical protein
MEAAAIGLLRNLQLQDCHRVHSNGTNEIVSFVDQVI